jgi:hypothetical protein
MSQTGAKPQKAVRNTRRYPRYALDVRMSVQVFRSGAVSYFWGRSTEFGQDGIGGTLTGELEVGEVVSLEFPLQTSPMPMRVRAIVRYQIGLHYGFEFLTLTEAQRAAVIATCERLALST